MSTAVLRERKDGGYSPCKAKEEDVGKRKCCHVPGTVSFELKVNEIDKHLKEVIVPKDFTDMQHKDKVKFVSEVAKTLKPAKKELLDEAIEKLRSL